MSKDIKFFSHNKSLDWNKGIYDNLIANDEGVRILSKEKYRLLENIEIEAYNTEKVEDIILKSKNYIYIHMKDNTLWQYNANACTMEYFMDLSHEGSNILLESGNDALYLMRYGDTDIPTIKAYSTIAKEKIWEMNSIQSKKFYPIKISVDQYNYLYLIFIYLEDIKAFHDQEKYPLYIMRIDPRGNIKRIFEYDVLEIEKTSSIDNLNERFYMDALNRQIIIYDKYKNKLFKINDNNEIQELDAFLDDKYICTGMSVDSYKNIIMVIKEKNKEFDENYLACVKEDTTMEFYSKLRGRDLRKLTKNLDGDILCPHYDKGIVTVFTIKKEHIFSPFTGKIEGRLISTALDGEEKQLRWHRICIDADIPEDTFVKISIFSMDTKEIYVEGKKIEIDQYIQNPNINFEQKENLLQPFWKEDFINVRDVLLHNHSGRYLWYKISLIGNQESTPIIKRIRIYYPMVSFIQYLPEIYQFDPINSEFLIRFLGIFQTMMLDLETEIDSISQYFDPDIVDKEFLHWLSSWLGIEDAYLWEEISLRSLIKNAMYIYKKKGTKESIEKIVELYTGQKPFIVENHIISRLMNDNVSKKYLQELYGDSPYIFTIVLKDENLSESKYKSLKKIIENNKPAYTEVNIVVLKPFLFLDDHTYLGINSILSQRIPLRLNNYSTVSVSTILAE